MSLVRIYDPGKGVFTACDQDELPPGFATDLENFYLDRPGKIRKRDGVLAYGSGFPEDRVLRNLFRFVHKDLTGGAVWISFWDDGGGDCYVYVSNAAGSSWTLVENMGAVAAGDEMRALVIGVILRLAFSRSISPVWYGYLKRKFFHDLWDHSYTTPVWYDCDAALKYPATWDYSSLTLRSASGGELGVGHHFYKVVPVFDGGQQALFASGKAHYEIESGDTRALLLTMGFSTADWNPRITHLNIYRQINPDTANDDDALYQLVEMVSTQNNPAVVTGTGDTMEKKWYDRDVPWGAADLSPTGNPDAPVNGDQIHVLDIPGDAGAGYVILSSNASGLLTLRGEPAGGGGDIFDADGELDQNYYSDQSYTIDQWEYDGNDWGVISEDAYSGTDGWGGAREIYVSAADYEDNEFLKYLIKEGSNIRVILGNNDRVLYMDGDPTDGTGKTLIIGKWLWLYSSPDASLWFLDTGLLDKGHHPLAGITSVEAYYKYHVYFKGRLYCLNLAFDPSGENEEYPDWVGFSEVDQPDVISNKNFIMPDNANGGEGKGIFALDKADALAVFYRHDIAYLKVPRADPTAWSKHEHEGDIGLINDAAIVRTPIGYFFCYDTGIYFMDLDGAIKGPVSFPIDDVYRAAVAAGSGSSFSAMYLSERRIVLFGLGTDTQAWALEIDSIFPAAGGASGGDYPKWFKFPFGTVSAVQVRPERSVIDESGYFYMHQWEGTAIYRINEALTGTESFGTKFKGAFIRTGDMKKKHLVREARINHKGSDNVTPKIYFDDGATSDTKTAIVASANGEDRRISVKRRCRNVALELTTPASTNTDHEIRGMEMEVVDG